MDSDAVGAFYEEMGFELVEIDDREVLFYQLDDDGTYATITDDNGNVPADLDSPIIFSVYDENDSYQWSVTLEDSHYFGQLFARFAASDDLLANLRDIRQENIARFDASEL